MTLFKQLFLSLENCVYTSKSILISYILVGSNITHIYSSYVLLDMSITPISMFQILPYKMSLRLLLKILLPVMDLNMANKSCKAIMNTRNSDFGKSRFSVKTKSGFQCYISRSSAPYAPLFPLLTLILYNYRPQQPQPPLPRATHISSTRQPSCETL